MTHRSTRIRDVQKRCARSARLATLAAAAVLALPAVAEAASTITWTPDELLFVADPATGTEAMLTVRDLGGSIVPAFSVTGTVDYPAATETEPGCLEDAGYIVCDPAAATRLVGGPGADTLIVMDGFPVAATVSLQGNGGADDLRDATAAGRTLDGGSGDDTLSGSGGADVLSGDGGADTIRGGDQADVVRGGAGRDELLGGLGKDTIRARDGQRDSIDCGRGTDTAIVDAFDVVRRCERVRRRG